MEKKNLFKGMMLWIAFAAVMFSSCSMRNFDNPVLKNYYNGPIITVVSPTNGNNIDGAVPLVLQISDVSGVKSVTVYTPDLGSWEFQNYSLSDTMFINTNIIFPGSGIPTTKNITITARDGVNAESQTYVNVNVTINTPWVSVFSPPTGFSSTNVTSLTLSGTSGVGAGSSIISLKTVRMNDNAEFSVTGFGAWTSDVTLLPNCTNHFRILATSDKGIPGSTDVRIVQDSVIPVLNVIYPTNGGFAPKSFEYRLDSSDPLSGILKIVYWIDDGQPYTNHYSYAGWWYSGLTNGVHRAYAIAFDKAGNATPVRTNTFTVDGTIPIIQFQSYFGSTNLTTPWFYGYCEVDAPTNITKIEISKNDGPYTEVNTYTPGTMVVYWTNKNTTGLNINAHNKIMIRATSSAGKMNTFEFHFTIDTNAPAVNSFNPTNNSMIVNFDNIFVSAFIHDDLSPLEYVYLVSKNPDAGIQIQSNDIHNLGYHDYSFGLNSGNANFGGLFTNILIARDQAGNMTYRTNYVKVYPGVYVFTSGMDTNPGFGKQPFKTIQNAVNFARQYGINNVYIGAGTYQPGSGLIATGTGLTLDSVSWMTVSGGWEWDGPNNLIHTNYSRLDGVMSLNHVMVIRNSSGVFLNNLIIKGGKASAVGDNKGGGILMQNNNSGSITNCMLTNNTASGDAADGGGLYMDNSHNFYLHFIAVKNTANAGGAIAMTGCTWNRIYGVYYKNNALYNGGAMQIAGGNQNKIYATILENDAIHHGGGVALFNGNGDTLDWGSIIRFNKAGLGGGVYLSNYQGLYSYALVTNNFATNGIVRQGGGVCIVDSQNTYIYGAVVKNYANAGGGIAVKGGSYNYFYGIVKNNVAYSVGGGMAFTNSRWNQIYSTVQNNLCTLNGGGIAFYASHNNTILGATIYGNITTSSLPDSGGAGIAFMESSYNYINSDIYQNTATNNGGGIAILGGSGNTNYANINNNIAYKSGGGIAIKYGQNHYINGHINQNSSIDTSGGGGGGISANYTVSLVIDAKVYTNSALQHGGGISLYNCTNTMVYGPVFKNRVTSAVNSSMGGGGYYIYEGLNNSIYGSVNSNNVLGVQAFGGGIWIAGPNTINALVSYNSSTYGGGIYIWDNNVTVGGMSIVKSNIAQTFGGGIAVDSGPVGNNKIYGTIIGNSTVPMMAMGAGIYLSGKKNIVQAKIIDNFAVVAGLASGIYVTNTVDNKIMNCTISNNNNDNSFVLGGNNINLMISNNIIAAQNNFASYGITEMITVSVTGHIIKDNKFVFALLQYAYYDSINSIITNPAELTIGNTGASIVSGNVWW